jgi:hypothetical protein
MKLYFLDYRYAGSVLDHPTFKKSKSEVLDVLKSTQVPLLDPNEPEPRRGGVKRRKRDPLRGDTRDRYFFLPVDQKELNRKLDTAFSALGWQLQPAVVPPNTPGGPVTGLKADYKKGRLEVEVQFGNMARWYTDVFKFQLSYSLEHIDAAILVVPTQHLANLIDENVAYFERVARELPHARMSLTLPIWVIGVEPDDFTAARVCYEQAAVLLSDDFRNKGKEILVVPYDQRIREEPPAET